MEHQMKLKQKPFSSIKNGEKTIELRLYDEKRRKIQIGDQIVFSHMENPEDQIRAKVADLHLFNSFADLYQALPLTKCGYTKEEAQTAGPEDMNLYYSVEEQSKYGVVGIEIALIEEE